MSHCAGSGDALGPRWPVPRHSAWQAWYLDIYLRYQWQARHLWHCAGSGRVSHIILSHTTLSTQLCHTHTHHLSQNLCHTPSSTHNFVTHIFVTQHLCHTTSLINTHHCHTPSLSHTIFATHHFSHTSLLHTTLPHTCHTLRTPRRERTQ